MSFVKKKYNRKPGHEFYEKKNKIGRLIWVVLTKEGSFFSLANSPITFTSITALKGNKVRDSNPKFMDFFHLVLPDIQNIHDVPDSVHIVLLLTKAEEATQRQGLLENRKKRRHITYFFF
jgi:hypothetical protein